MFDPKTFEIEKTESQRANEIADQYKVEYAVALDIDYLRCLEKRIITAAKKHPEIRDFAVVNRSLEQQLDALGA